MAIGRTDGGVSNAIRDDFFETIAGAIPQMVWLAAPDGRIYYFNKAWTDYTGLSESELLGEGSKGIGHPDEVAQTWERWTTSIATGQRFEWEYRLRRGSDGAFRWFLGRAVPVRAEDGSILHWIGTATDIDAQKRANANLQFVMEASVILSASYDVQQICDELACLAINRICDWCSITLLQDDGSYRTAAVEHTDRGLLEFVNRFRDRYPPRPGSPLDTVVRQGRPLLIPVITLEQLQANIVDEEQMQILERLKLHSAMIVPLATDDGKVYGGATFVSAESVRTFTEDDLDVAVLVAKRAAAAIHTAKDFGEERLRADRMHFIARASELAFESLDLAQTLENVCRFVVSDMADLAYVMLVEDGSALRTAASAHREPERAHLAARLRGERTLRPESEESAIRMLAQHRTILQSSIATADVLPHMWEYLAPEVRELNVRSAITVPLFSRGETLGALVAYWCETPKRYTQADEPVFSDLGRRLSVAIDHIRTIERERRIAKSLQEALLPTPGMLPKDPVLRFSAQYCPSSNEADVGGDWYDAVRLTDGSIMISVGDVTGRGLHAAGLMGKLRQAIGMTVLYEPDPARALDAVDFHLRSRGSQAIVTAFLGIISPDHKTLRYANAGHPSPLLRRNDELTELRSSGLPLGLRDESAPEQSVEVSLDDAQMMVLYTDGLVEGTRDLAFGDQRLRQIALTQAVLNVRNPASLFCDACLPFDAQDDTAVLTIVFGKRTRWAFDAENAEAAKEARTQFVAALKERAGADSDFNAAELVFGELIGNVVRHAPGPIDVQVDWTGENPVLHVVDRGKGFIRDPALPVDPLSESGRGLYIISQLTHGLTIERIPGYGNHVAVELKL